MVPADASVPISRFVTYRVRHCLEPDRLPDARHGRIPDALGFEHLLSAGLRPLVGRIPHAHDQFLIACPLQGRGDIEGERIVAAAMSAHLPSVHEHVRFPVDRSEMQEHSRSARDCTRPERPAVPDALLIRDGRRNATQLGLHGKGHEYLPGKRLRLLRSRIQDGVVPEAVQVLPSGPCHFGARILGPHARRRHLGCPLRAQLRGRRLRNGRSGDADNEHRGNRHRCLTQLKRPHDGVSYWQLVNR